MLRRRQIYLPLSLREQYFRALHYPPSVGHLGIEKTLRRLRSRVYWPGMRADVRTWIQVCEPCQRSKPERGLPFGKMLSARPRHIFHTIYIDFYGPKPKSTGAHTYAFVMVDAATRLLDIRLTNLSDARTSIHQITKFCQRWGFPKIIVSDNAPSFKSFEFQSKCQQMGATNRYTAAYHPQPNLAERLNQSLKSCILAYIDDHTRWDLHIGFFVLAINTAYQISLKYSPYQMVVGQEARYPGDIDTDTDDGEPLPPSVAENLHLHMTQMRERATENLKRAQIQHKRWFDVHRRTHDFQPGDWVTLKNR
uniref:RNA-directed DNA polymerase n=1 Tax=Strigamia maritima TaxID=126957 RepID=T1IWZ6_STRMM